MKRLIIGLLACLPFFSSAAMAESIYSNLTAYTAKDCAPVVEDYLEKNRIDTTKITGIEYITNELNGGEHGEEKEYEAWASFSNCTGNLVIRMDKACFIQADYATYECDSKGISKR